MSQKLMNKGNLTKRPARIRPKKSRSTRYGIAPEDMKKLRRGRIQFFMTKVGLNRKDATIVTDRTIAAIEEVEIAR